jgi:hypothetical protein
MKYQMIIFVLIVFIIPCELSAQIGVYQFSGGYHYNIGGKYNIMQYRANVRKEPNINSDVIAILSVHDEIEIMENTFVEEEINNFVAFWYKIKYRNIVGYTFGGNIAAVKLIVDIDNNYINDYFYFRCYKYRDDNFIRFATYDRLITNRDIMIYMNNDTRLGTNELIFQNFNYGHEYSQYFYYGNQYSHYLTDRCQFINNGNHVLIKLSRWVLRHEDVVIYKVNSNGLIEYLRRYVVGDPWSVDGYLEDDGMYF